MWGETQIGKDEYGAILAELIPNCDRPDRKAKYSKEYHGYNPRWAYLSRPELHAAMVYMLGKLMWYIFECPAGMVVPVVMESLRVHDPNTPEFPTFKHTPVGLRQCIESATSGAPEWQGRYQPFCVRGNKIVLRDRGAGAGTGSIVSQVQAAAREWWRQEVEDAKTYVRSRIDNKSIPESPDSLLDSWKRRPTLEQILEAVESIASIM